MLKSAAVAAAVVLTLSASPALTSVEPGVSTATVVGASMTVAPKNFWCAFLRMCN